MVTVVLCPEPISFETNSLGRWGSKVSEYEQCLKTQTGQSVFVHQSSSFTGCCGFIVSFPFIYINCKHSTLHMNGNVVKGNFLWYKTDCKLCMGLAERETWGSSSWNASFCLASLQILNLLEIENLPHLCLSENASKSSDCRHGSWIFTASQRGSLQTVMSPGCWSICWRPYSQRCEEKPCSWLQMLAQWRAVQLQF